MALSRDNGQHQSPKAHSRAMADLGWGCSYPHQRNFPQRTATFPVGHIPDFVVAVAFCFVDITASAAVRAEGIVVDRELNRKKSKFE